MIRPLAILAFLCLGLAGCDNGAPGDNAALGNEAANGQASAPPRPAAPLPDIVRVGLTTDAGTISLALDARHAPITTANFLAYVEQHKFDDMSFYRAARTRGSPGSGYIQGGINHIYARMLPPIAHEPTSRTGLHHVAGTISMARAAPGTAMGDFFITTSAMPAMDAHGREPGYAAFGRVTGGMDVVRHILAAPTSPTAGSGAMRGQMIAAPVRIVSAARLPD